MNKQEFIDAMDIQQDEQGNWYVRGSVRGDVLGSVKGSVLGDVKGSVFGSKAS